MRIIIFILALLLFIFGVVLSFLGKTTEMVATYGAGVLCLVFVFLSQFKKFKGLGIEAEMWEKEMEKAEELVSRLQSLAIVVARPVFKMVSRMGYWGSAFTRKERYEVMREMENELKSNKVPTDLIEEASMQLHMTNAFELARPILRDLNALKGQNRSKEKITTVFKGMAFGQIYNVLQALLNDREVLSEEEMEKICEDNMEWLKDLKHYIDKKEFRRLDDWLKEENK